MLTWLLFYTSLFEAQKTASQAVVDPGDIRATIASMVAHGVHMLPIPENYYDDLEARTDLSPAEIEELAALNVLYDRDANGVFLQVYTTSLDCGFFFEIVQRDGYAGYGAPNAGIRLAAQARLVEAVTVLRY